VPVAENTSLQPTAPTDDACGPDVCVLIVDDRTENLDVLEALLQRPGLKLLRASNGRDALELLLEHEVALALLDVHMPEMDGFELAELMRGTDRTRNVPIIFVAAATPAVERIFRGYEAGAVDFLFKPINAQLLQSKVNVFIELFRRRRQLAEQVEEHKALTRTAELLIGVLSHDLRTPLGAIEMASEILARAHPADAQTLDMTSRIKSSSRRMMRMIEQLLDFANARVGGRLPVRPADVDLEELCDGALYEFESARERIVLTAEGDTRGRWDPDRLLQVVSNLVSNALQHGERDTPVRIDVDGRDPDAITIRVSNRGTILPDEQANLFSPFLRTGSPTRGSGLGLYIVDSIVRTHGGTVGVDSADNQTTFTVRLPRLSAGTA
jgi:two-component system sensor histidine kinase/response regulator